MFEPSVTGGTVEVTPVTVEEVQAEVLKYRQNISAFMTGAQELEKVLGPNIFPKLIHIGAGIALADIQGADRPAPFLLKLLPNAIVEYLDTGSQLISIAVQTKIIPTEMLERIAGDEQEAQALFSKLKDLRK